MNNSDDPVISAITQHNIVFQASLMGRARDAVVAGTFPDFLRSFFKTYFSAPSPSSSGDKQESKRRQGTKEKEESEEDKTETETEKTEGGPTYPKWCVDALRSVGVDILEGLPDARVVDGNGAKWDYADADG